MLQRLKKVGRRGRALSHAVTQPTPSAESWIWHGVSTLSLTLGDAKMEGVDTRGSRQYAIGCFVLTWLPHSWSTGQHARHNTSSGERAHILRCVLLAPSLSTAHPLGTRYPVILLPQPNHYVLQRHEPRTRRPTSIRISPCHGRIGQR